MSTTAWGNPFESGRIIGRLCTTGRAIVQMEDGQFHEIRVDFPTRKQRRRGETKMIALHNVEAIVLGRLHD